MFWMVSEMASIDIRVDQAQVAETFVDEAYTCIQKILKLEPDRKTIREFEKLQNFLDEACFAIEDDLENQKSGVYESCPEDDSEDDCEGSGNPANRFGAED